MKSAAPKRQNQLQSEGLDAQFLLIDPTDVATVADAVREVEEKFGKLDVLINNAGAILAADFGDPVQVPMEVLRETFELNAFGMHAVTQAFWPLLNRAPAARVVMMSSSLGSLAMKLHIDTLHAFEERSIVSFFDWKDNDYKGQPALDTEVERALRSCLGSEVSDASRHAATVLFQLGARDEAVMQHMIPYLQAPRFQDRLDTIGAFQQSSDGFFAIEFADNLGLGSRKMRAACQAGEAGSISPRQLKLLLRLIEVQKNETAETYSLRRCCFEWLWSNLKKNGGAKI